LSSILLSLLTKIDGKFLVLVLSLCYSVLHMRETLTISLPKRLRRDLEKMARAEGVTSSEYVRRAIKADLFRRALRAARRELVPQARARGIYTDEDVFKIVS
jgi:Arc/MetJ-type ribon-helix-helix transcriptional regulator